MVDEDDTALRNAIRESEDLETTISDIHPSDINSSAPAFGAATLFVIAMQHMGSMRILAATGDFDASVRALLRPMIESCFRAIWIALIAKPDEAELAINDAFQMPMLSPKLAKTLDAHFHGDFYSRMIHDIGALHDLTHSGYEQMIRNYDETLGIRALPNKKECAEIIERATLMAGVTYGRIHEILAKHDSSPIPD